MTDQIIPPTPALRRDAIGLREVLFQSITDMAPGAAIAASIPAGAALAGGSLPLVCGRSPNAAPATRPARMRGVDHVRG